MEQLSSDGNLKVVVPGDYIDEGQGLTAGHGTFESKEEEEEDSKIYASVAGVVHYINKYVCVKPLRQAYKPDIGDVIVGRIVQVQGKSWSVDIGAYQHAVLNLTNINLPGGEQRRRNEDDQLNMRQFFREGDMISAEVQNVGTHDGRITLQTRNLKYGRLSGGFLTQIDSNYVRRSKVHIHDMGEASGCQGLSMILGVNGYVWIHQKGSEPSISPEAREKMSLLRNCVVSLEKAHIPIFKDTILKCLESASSLKAKDVIRNGERVTKEARKLVEKEVSMHMPQANMLSIGMLMGQQSEFIMNH
ncbi:hypothetical protein FGO68_gene16856 [Halteria grandinella]|uniref:S1 motif domain-containing protein n=1 Tax=Halteria grandinella TaxID=5974 RepID=A0A8J8NKX5_HALGN|nr:hypothetical protein FGO68_gene16856 [Halteria grandinella]